MARDKGPRLKKMRALGVNLPGLSRKSMKHREFPPGEHGQARRRKPSDYALQLKEKQKLRFNYGLGERQFRRLVAEARRGRKAAGDQLLEFLERRLDNVVFRTGFAPTIPAARQLVNHGHITVNGRRVDVSSFRVKEGDVIRPREKSLKLDVIATSLLEISLMRPDWIDFDEKTLTAKVAALPSPDSVPFPIDVSSVIEYYAKRL
jgi:small subunit ribosomal protein S4